MKELLTIIVACLVFANCAEKKIDRSKEACSIEATVVDLRSLDGCDFVFELKDGTRLLPERRVYIQAPTKESDPIYYYQFKNGARVNIGYQESQALGSCMAGQLVFITCITDL